MGDYTHDIFYKNNHLSIKEKEQLCRETHAISYKWWVDHLKTTQRQRIDMDLDTILGMLDKATHFFFIHRKGFENWKNKEWHETSWCLEVGFMAGIYYLWILVDEKEIPHFVEKYNLNPI
jgi:hypothetical protein